MATRKPKAPEPAVRTTCGPGEHLLHEIIRSARRRAKLSQPALAQLLGVKQPAVAGWESGTGPILETTLEKIAAALGMDVETMLYTELTARRRERRRHAAEGAEGADPGPADEPTPAQTAP